MAHLVVQDVGAAVIRRRAPLQQDLAVAGFGAELPRRGRHRRRRAPDPRGVPGRLADHRPHLEGVGRAVGQAADRHRQIGPGGLPGRRGRHAPAFGIAVFVVVDLRAAGWRRGPGQRDLSVARRRRQAPRRGRSGERGCLDPPDGPGAPVVHRPHLEGVDRAVFQAAEVVRALETCFVPSLVLRHAGALGIAHPVVQEVRAAVVQRRGPSEVDPAKGALCLQLLRRTGYRHRRRLDPRDGPGRPGVQRAHLESVEHAASRDGDGHLTGKAGELPGG